MNRKMIILERMSEIIGMEVPKEIINDLLENMQGKEITENNLIQAYDDINISNN